MNNVDILNGTAEDQAHDLFYEMADELPGKLAKITNTSVLEALKVMAIQQDRTDILKLTEARIAEL